MQCICISLQCQYSFSAELDAQSRSRYSRHRRWFPPTTKHPSSVTNFSTKLWPRRKFAGCKASAAGLCRCISRKSRAVSGENIKVLNTAPREEVADSVMAVRHLIFMMTRHYGYPGAFDICQFQPFARRQRNFIKCCNVYIERGIIVENAR